MNCRYLIGLVAAAAVGAAATLPAQTSPDDSSFVLSSADPARSPSPFVGNGRLGVVVPALGIGASDAFLAGLYEEAEGDVPRIAAIPSWTGVGVFDGERWLDSSSAAAVRGYSQVLDMRSGTHQDELRLGRRMIARLGSGRSVRFASRPPSRRHPRWSSHRDKAGQPASPIRDRGPSASTPPGAGPPGTVRSRLEARRHLVSRDTCGSAPARPSVKRSRRLAGRHLDAGGTQDDARAGGRSLVGRRAAPRRAARAHARATPRGSKCRSTRGRGRPIALSRS